MNKVIIFGGDHYNSLGLARVFGVNGIKPDGILTIYQKNYSRIFAAKSKYWNRVINVDSEEEGLRKIIEDYSHEKEKPVLVPSSDKAELIIDKNKKELEEHFYVPGFKDERYSVLELMNKYTQAKWAQELGLNIALTWELNLLGDLQDEMRKVNKYPCILKPVLSSEGKKTDIKKCNDAEELRRTLRNLESKGYNRILAQEFLDKEYEMELFGSILTNEKVIPFFLTKHLREWPRVGGSVSCHEFIVDKKLKDKAEEILAKIRDFGYSGNIDIELFKIGDSIYLNEVNFRNSGDVYACFYNKLYYPFIWYLDTIGKGIKHLNTQYTNRKFAMNETTDFRHVIHRNIKLREWLKYYRNCGDFAIRFPGDMKPYYALHKYYIKTLFRRKKSEK